MGPLMWILSLNLQVNQKSSDDDEIPIMSSTQSHYQDTGLTSSLALLRSSENQEVDSIIFFKYEI